LAFFLPGALRPPVRRPGVPRSSTGRPLRANPQPALVTWPLFARGIDPSSASPLPPPAFPCWSPLRARTRSSGISLRLLPVHDYVVPVVGRFFSIPSTAKPCGSTMALKISLTFVQSSLPQKRSLGTHGEINPPFLHRQSFSHLAFQQLVILLHQLAAQPLQHRCKAHFYWLILRPANIRTAECFKNEGRARAPAPTFLS